MRTETSALTAGELAEKLEHREPLFILDVRNAEPYAQWRIEGPGPVPSFNLPYFVFIEDEEGGLDRLPWTQMAGREIVVVCAKGGASDYVAELLRRRGATAQNLTGGMLAWSQLYRFKTVADGDGLTLLQVQRPGKGCLSYMIGSGGACLVVDAGHQVEVYAGEAARRGWTITHVADTHLHADHLSGGRRLAADVGAEYLLPPQDALDVTFDHRPLPDGAPIEVGGSRVRAMALHTPGHTPGSTCLRIADKYLLTGDTLFLAGIGRPDLGGQAGHWVENLYDTVHGRLNALPGDVAVLPGHYEHAAEQDERGIFAARLAALRSDNPLLRLHVRDEFRSRVLSSMPDQPNHYQAIREINKGLRAAVDAAERAELEIGPNRCAAGA